MGIRKKKMIVLKDIKNILWKKYRNQCVERCRFDDSSGENLFVFMGAQEVENQHC